MISSIDKWFYNITVQRSTPTTDSWGNTIQTWAYNSTVRGLLRKLSGSEVNTSRKDTPIGSYRMYCRLADITTNDRLLFSGKYYSVTSVNNVMGFDELMQVECELV